MHPDAKEPLAGAAPKAKILAPQPLLEAAGESAIHVPDPAARDRFAAVVRDRLEWSLIKRNASRSVYRAVDSRGPLYLKHFHSQSLGHRLGEWLGRMDARMEYECIARLRAAGVSVPTPLAACWSAGSHWLITEGVEPAQSGDLWHAEQAKAGNWRAIRQATLALADLVARMHQAGVTHPDLHLGNVLVRTDGERPELVLIDLHRMGRHRRLSLRNRAANLAILLGNRFAWTTAAERLRFLRRYMEHAGGPMSVGLWLDYIEPAAFRLRRRYLSQCNRRILRNNGYFARMRIAGYRVHSLLRTKCRVPSSLACTRETTAAEWQAVLREPDALQDGRRLRIADSNLNVCICRREYTCCWPMRSAALRAFVMGHRLMYCGFFTAVPLAVLEKRRRGRVETILITERQTGRPLGESLRQCRRRGVSSAAAELQYPGRPLAWQLGRWLRRLQEEGFVLEGLNCENVLVCRDGQTGQVQDHRRQFILSGLEALCGQSKWRIGRPSLQRRFGVLQGLVASLRARGAISRADELRMLLGWLSEMTDHKPYWRLMQETT